MIKNKEDLINHTLIAKVVNNIDNKERNRCQIRIIGITPDSTKDSDCPWAEIKGVLFSTYEDLNGVSSVPGIGTFVYVDFLYGNVSFPLISGICRGAKDSSFLHTVKNLAETIYQTRLDNLIGPELPPLNNNTQAPNNNVIETKNIVIELDDTSGNERISIQHKNGSYIEIRPNGDIQIKSSNNEYSLIKANYTNVTEGSRSITTTTTTHIGDVIVTGDVIVSGIVKAKDCISTTVSGKNHTHTGDSGGTTSPPNQ